MIASVSTAVSASLSGSSRAAASTTTGWYYVQVPDLNTATHRLIGKAKAGWTFETICRLIHHVGRVGTAKARKAAKADQTLGVGLAAIAAESGQSLGKVRRDCDALAGLGLIVVTHPNVMMIRDAEGRLTENRTGRSKATVIHLTITQEHVRQKAGNPAETERPNPAIVEGLPAAVSVHPGRAIQRDFQTERTPDGGAVGIGTPPADRDAGLPAGEAPASILPVNAGRDEPAMPAGRILPPQRPQAATPRQRRTAGHDEPRTAAEAAEAFHRPDPRMAQLRREWETARRRKAAGNAPQAAPPPTAPPPPFDQAAATAAVLDALGKAVG